ncbi:MAG: potassium-transporting ATPase subunit KdpC [Caldilineaceae bacterium]
MLRKFIFPALRMLVVLTILTGLLYPGLVTLAATPLFPTQAAGSLIDDNGVIVGSTLVGQANQDARYFWPRPSAVNYMDGSHAGNLGASGATNAAPTSRTLAATVAARADAFRMANHLAADTPVPADMLFASGSGLDPHISPAAAQLQVARVAAARHLEPAVVAALVTAHTEPPQWGFMGMPRVNVLLLNLALDQVK